MAKARQNLLRYRTSLDRTFKIEVFVKENEQFTDKASKEIACSAHRLANLINRGACEDFRKILKKELT